MEYITANPSAAAVRESGYETSFSLQQIIVKVPLHMNLVPQFSSSYYQNVIFQKLYIHFLSNLARRLPYDRAYFLQKWTRNGYIVPEISHFENNFLKSVVPSSCATVL